MLHPLANYPNVVGRDNVEQRRVPVNSGIQVRDQSLLIKVAQISADGVGVEEASLNCAEELPKLKDMRVWMNVVRKPIGDREGRRSGHPWMALVNALCRDIAVVT